MATIEVDSQVYAWLQGLAVPFEDNSPNDVLRKLMLTDKNQSGIPIDDTSPIDLLRKHTATMEDEQTPRLDGETHVSIGVRRVSNGRMGHRVGRPKLDRRVLAELGVSHFEVNGMVPEYRSQRARRGERAHERAYLDAMLDSGKTPVPYFQRWKERGLPNPRGDAASRVILKVGSNDRESRVHFKGGRVMIMADFVEAFLSGNL